MSRAVRLGLSLFAALLLLTACGSGGSSNVAATSVDSSGTTTVDITFKGSTVTPAGKLVKLKAGQPLKLHIMADKAGELHVHSSPEQEIAYQAGSTEKTLKISQPGVVEVESHTLDKLVLQLQVR